MSPEQVDAEVDRLEALIHKRERQDGQVAGDRLRTALRHRRELLEQNRLRMNCCCRDCLAGHITEDPARLCPNGYQTLLQWVRL